MRTLLCIVSLLPVFCCTANSFLPLKWHGDTQFFDFQDNSVFSRLNENTGYAEIYAEQQISGNCSWQFNLRYKFNPSSANHSIIYISGTKEAFNTMDGYYVSIGASNDALQFYERTDGRETLLIQGEDKRLDLSNIDIDIRLTRTKEGNWELFSKLPNEESFTLEGTSTNNTYNEIYRFGWVCNYTKTRVDKFELSDINISGDVFQDTIPPKLLAFDVVNAETLLLTFDEPIQASVENFKFLKHQTGISSVLIEKNKAEVRLNTSLKKNEKYTIQMSGIQDEEGNLLSELEYTFHYFPFSLKQAFVYDSTSVFVDLNKPIAPQQLLQQITFNGVLPNVFTEVQTKSNAFILHFTEVFPSNIYAPLKIDSLHNKDNNELLDTTIELVFHPLERGDIVLNEIMADPSPSVQLPEVEYLEVYNNSDYPVSFHQFNLHINNTEFTFDEYRTFPPQTTLLIVSKKDTNQYTKLANLTFPSSSFQLNNQEFETWISTENGKVVDYFYYSADVYDDPFKSDGGWSLERIDYNNLSAQQNWMESENEQGGTPGFENSIGGTTKDQILPTVEFVAHLEDSSIRISFTEVMLEESLKDTENYLASEANISMVSVQSPSQSAVEVKFTEKLTAAKTYEIELKNLFDLSGNLLEPFRYSFQLPEEPMPGDVIFNELMINPLDGCPEYIELYNRSSNFIDLSALVLSEIGDAGDLKAGASISQYSVLFPPETYVLLTKDIKGMHDCYEIPPQTQVLEIPQLPTLNNDSEKLALVTKSATEINRISYTEEWHSPLVKNSKGVSLERTSFNGPINDNNSWTSAASTVGYATPGFENSQLINEGNSPNKIKLEYENITPDNDGFRDALVVQFPDAYAGYSISIQIFNATGRLVQEIYRHYYLGTQSTLSIPNLSYTEFPSGIYGLRVKGVHPNGQTVEEMLPFVISFK